MTAPNRDEGAIVDVFGRALQAIEEIAVAAAQTVARTGDRVGAPQTA